jgi:hypothetical protein
MHYNSSIVNENPLLAHDITNVRREALHRLSSLHGEQAMVDEAMEVSCSSSQPITTILIPCVALCANPELCRRVSIRGCETLSRLFRRAADSHRSADKRQRQPHSLLNLRPETYLKYQCARSWCNETFSCAIHCDRSTNACTSQTHPLHRRLLRLGCQRVSQCWYDLCLA